MSIIKLDINEAKEIHKANIREARSSKLAELDIEFMMAQETGADTSAIVAKKQALRDAPAAVICPCRSPRSAQPSGIRQGHRHAPHKGHRTNSLDPCSVLYGRGNKTSPL